MAKERLDAGVKTTWIWKTKGSLRFIKEQYWGHFDNKLITNKIVLH